MSQLFTLNEIKMHHMIEFTNWVVLLFLITESGFGDLYCPDRVSQVRNSRVRCILIGAIRFSESVIANYPPGRGAGYVESKSKRAALHHGRECMYAMLE